MTELSLRVNGRILITDGADTIEVLVVSVDPRQGRVRLGITAPRHVAVDREEVRQLKTMRGIYIPPREEG